MKELHSSSYLAHISKLFLLTRAANGGNLTIAVISGVTGQDGYFLTKLLRTKTYEKVIGLCSPGNRQLALDTHGGETQTFCVYEIDLADSLAIVALFRDIRARETFDTLEIYHLAALSHVGNSYTSPEVTCDIDALGPLRILEALRETNLVSCSKFLQAGSAEQFGKCTESPQTEQTPFNPVSPYGAAKVFAHQLVKIYRDHHRMFACNAILYNHESERRPPSFVTRKITLHLSEVLRGERECLELGYMDAQRDWGYAADYVRGMWLMLQQSQPDDYILASTVLHSVRDFVTEACRVCDLAIAWEGSGVDEVARNTRTGAVVVRINPEFYRPAEPSNLVGDATKAKTLLGWEPQVTFLQMVELMVKHDLGSGEV